MSNKLEYKVLKLKSKLKEIGVSQAKYYFSLKYPEYLKDSEELDNLWYGKISNEEFTEKLEAFVIYKQEEFS